MAPSPPAGRDSSDGGLMGYGLKIKRGVSRVFTRQRLFPIQCTVAGRGSKPEAQKSKNQIKTNKPKPKHHIKYQQTSHHQSNRRSQGRRFTTEQRKRKSRIRMGRISFLSKIPPPPPILAAHYHRSYHYNASNASPVSFLLLIATVAAGEVLAIFVCKIIADYGTLLLG